jgi:23S rRNA (uracil1939-C5)-methyltransferase
MIKINDIIDVKIASFDNHGYGIARIDNAIIFIPKAIPEDTVRIKITKFKKKYGSAEIIKIITPSKNRINPVCQDFIKGCGGCQWLNLKYEEELFWKTKLVRDAFKNKAKINIKVQPVIGMDKPSKFRNKLSLLQINNKIGLMKENSKTIISFDDCRQELDANQNIYSYMKKIRFDASIKQIHLRSNSAGESLVCFYADSFNEKIKKIAVDLKRNIKSISGIGVLTKSGYQNIIGEEYIIEEINKIKYMIPNNSFFQTNYKQAFILQNAVRKMLDIKEKDKIIDVYCGVGFFTLDVARFCRNVIGIENNSMSIKYAFENAKLNKIKNTEFFENDAGNALKIFSKNTIKSMIIDPPRSGCEKNVLDEIIRINPEKIVYISCYIDSLIKDIIVFKNAGYKSEICQPVDMFPRTYHVENVVSLVKK